MRPTGGPRRGDRPHLDRLVSVPARRPGPDPTAADVVGVDLLGNPCRVAVTGSAHAWLLLFLGAHCDGCRPFWGAGSAPPSLGLAPGDAVAIVTRPAPYEDPGVIRSLLPARAAGVTAVLTGTAWNDYRVQGPPFFALVDAGRVVTEGVAWSVEYVATHVRRARASSSEPHRRGRSDNPRGERD